MFLVKNLRAGFDLAYASSDAKDENNPDFRLLKLERGLDGIVISASREDITIERIIEQDGPLDNSTEFSCFVDARTLTKVLKTLTPKSKLNIELDRNGELVLFNDIYESRIKTEKEPESWIIRNDPPPNKLRPIASEHGSIFDWAKEMTPFMRGTDTSPDLLTLCVDKDGVCATDGFCGFWLQANLGIEGSEDPFDTGDSYGLIAQKHALLLQKERPEFLALSPEVCFFMSARSRLWIRNERGRAPHRRIKELINQALTGDLSVSFQNPTALLQAVRSMSPFATESAMVDIVPDAEGNHLDLVLGSGVTKVPGSLVGLDTLRLPIDHLGYIAELAKKMKEDNWVMNSLSATDPFACALGNVAFMSMP